MPTEPATLELRGITKSYGAINALTDVNLDLMPGHVLGLLGDNGAGKSTLVKIMAGVHQPDAGTINVGGRPAFIRRPSEATRLGIATVYQDLALCENLDVAANLYLGRERSRLGLCLSKAEMERTARSLLSELAVKIKDPRVPVAALSGGQRQSVAIARALLGEPRVVLLDEPTAALGVEQTAGVLDLIRRLRDRGLAVVVITHNMADAMAVTDRICVLRHGRVAGLYETPKTSHEEIVASITGATTTQRSPAAGHKSDGQTGALQ